MARISPVCGFMTTVTPWLTPATSMPHVRACVARRCTPASMVSIRFVPGSGSRMVSITLPSRPDASRSTSWDPYVPRSSSSYEASMPALPMTSSRRYPPASSDSSCSRLTGPMYPRTCDSSRPPAAPVSSRYWRMGSTSITTPGSWSASSPMSRAASRPTPRAIGTRSNGEPLNASRRPRRVARLTPISSATRPSTRVRAVAGRSAGRTFTAHDGTLTTTGRPVRSNTSPRGARIGTTTVRSAATRLAYMSPLTTWSWNRRPPSVSSSTAARIENAMNRGCDR